MKLNTISLKGEWGHIQQEVDTVLPPQVCEVVLIMVVLQMRLKACERFALVAELRFEPNLTPKCFSHGRNSAPRDTLSCPGEEATFPLVPQF